MTTSMATRTFIGSSKPRSFSIHGIVSACLYLIHLILLCTLRESPWFLLQVGENVAADISLVWLRGNNPDINEELTVIYKI